VTTPPPETLTGDAIMKVKTNVKAGGIEWQHNETLVRQAPKPQPKGLRVKTNVKAGEIVTFNF
jgi:hypothetical protein